jgi:hypothetical protein
MSKCQTCKKKRECSKPAQRFRYCCAIGKPWEPRDDDKMRQMSDRWWNDYDSRNIRDNL